MTSLRTANIYKEKRQARQNQMNRFADHLLQVRNSCETQARNSIVQVQNHDDMIRAMEQEEKALLGTLQNTMKVNTSLMQDLSKKSEALTNRLIPRNPIVPKNKKYPAHSEFGYKPQPAVNRYNDLLLSKKNNDSSFSKRYRAGQRNSMAGGSESMTIDPDHMLNLHGFPS